MFSTAGILILKFSLFFLFLGNSLKITVSEPLLLLLFSLPKAMCLLSLFLKKSS